MKEHFHASRLSPLGIALICCSKDDRFDLNRANRACLLSDAASGNGCVPSSKPWMAICVASDDLLCKAPLAPQPGGGRNQTIAVGKPKEIPFGTMDDLREGLSNYRTNECWTSQSKSEFTEIFLGDTQGQSRNLC